MAKNGEFSVVEEPEEDSLLLEGDLTNSNNDDLTDDDDDGDGADDDNNNNNNKPRQRLEYAALFPSDTFNTASSGSVHHQQFMQIQVGDLALARKAWKKRRRSGSPLLVPCSVLNLDRTSLVRDNLLYLLYKFGTDQKDGTVLSLGELRRRYKSHLRGSLSVREEKKEDFFCIVVLVRYIISSYASCICGLSFFLIGTKPYTICFCRNTQLAWDTKIHETWSKSSSKPKPFRIPTEPKYLPYPVAKVTMMLMKSI